jgi:hypothetical protein
MLAVTQALYLLVSSQTTFTVLLVMQCKVDGDHDMPPNMHRYTLYNTRVMYGAVNESCRRTAGTIVGHCMTHLRLFYHDRFGYNPSSNAFVAQQSS